jgi:predicted RND superfamily exporter protein
MINENEFLNNYAEYSSKLTKKQLLVLHYFAVQNDRLSNSNAEIVKELGISTSTLRLSITLLRKQKLIDNPKKAKANKMFLENNQYKENTVSELYSCLKTANKKEAKEIWKVAELRKLSYELESKIDAVKERKSTAAITNIKSDIIKNFNGRWIVEKSYFKGSKNRLYWLHKEKYNNTDYRYRLHFYNNLSADEIEELYVSKIKPVLERYYRMLANAEANKKAQRRAKRVKPAPKQEKTINDIFGLMTPEEFKEHQQQTMKLQISGA